MDFAMTDAVERFSLALSTKHLYGSVYSRTNDTYRRAMLNGLHLLIVALNQLSGECAQVTEQSSGTVVSAAGVAAGSWLSGLAFLALMPKSIYWTVATEQFNMRLCLHRYRPCWRFDTSIVGMDKRWVREWPTKKHLR